MGDHDGGADPLEPMQRVLGEEARQAVVAVGGRGGRVVVVLRPGAAMGVDELLEEPAPGLGRQAPPRTGGRAGGDEGDVGVPAARGIAEERPHERDVDGLDGPGALGGPGLRLVGRAVAGAELEAPAQLAGRPVVGQAQRRGEAPAGGGVGGGERGGAIAQSRADHLAERVHERAFGTGPQIGSPPVHELDDDLMVPNVVDDGAAAAVGHRAGSGEETVRARSLR